MAGLTASSGVIDVIGHARPEHRLLSPEELASGPSLGLVEGLLAWQREG